MFCVLYFIDIREPHSYIHMIKREFAEEGLIMVRPLLN